MIDLYENECINNSSMLDKYLVKCKYYRLDPVVARIDPPTLYKSVIESIKNGSDIYEKIVFAFLLLLKKIEN